MTTIYPLDLTDPEQMQKLKLVSLHEPAPGVSVITFNRAAQANSFNLDASRELGDCLERLDRDQNVKVIILSGGAGQVFSAGADLRSLAEGQPLVPPEAERVHRGFAGVATHTLSTPIIAAVNGHAIGGGAEIALSCDIIVAAEDAYFRFPEPAWGIFAAGGGAVRLPTAIPRVLAMEMLLTGDAFSAAWAKESGLVNYVVPADQVLNKALAIANRIASHPTTAVAATKFVARGNGDGRASSESECWDINNSLFAQIVNSSTAREGLEAFVTKRDPAWRHPSPENS